MTEKISKTGIALLALAIGFLAGLAVGFIGAYHGSQFWYRELRSQNKEIEKRIDALDIERIKALNRAIQSAQKEMEDIYDSPEEK